MTGFDSMGMLNNYWGICGFSSALYGLYSNNAQMRSRLEKGAVTPTMLLAEIKSCLMMMKADGRTDLWKEIEGFTKTFKGFEDFTIEAYLARINSAVNLNNEALLKDPKFSMAMTPNGVVYYMQNLCELKNVKIAEKGDIKEGVLGLTKKDSDMKIQKGLKHWVYLLNGNIYSWGKQFASVDKLGYDGICWKIAI